MRQLGYAFSSEKERTAMKKLNVLLSIVIVFTSLASFAEDKKMIRIGVTQILSHQALDADQKGFEDALSGSGYKEGVNVTYDRQNAQGDMNKANAIAQKFMNDKVDLIHAIATPATQAVVKIAKNIPVVFSSITDPVAAGIVPKDSAPGKKTGTNVTGVSDRWPVSRQMEMYAKFVPKAKKWGTIYNPAEANSVVHIKEMKEAATKLGLELVEVTITDRSEVPKAMNSLVGKVQAIVMTSDNTAISNFEAIVKVCNEKKIALFTGDLESVAKGSIASYGMDYFLVGYSAGKKAVVVLKGLNPGEVPWGPMEKFSLVINAGAAKMQGVTIPPEILKKADKVLK
jgi:putative ABC transport system substrate-binding protein